MAKITLVSISLHDNPQDADEYFVEALLSSRWKQVGGPFGSPETAIKFAQKYSKDNGVKTRVVTSI